MSGFSSNGSSLSLIWWNVSLSPPASSKRDRSDKSKIDQVCNAIKLLILAKYDLIALGEVSIQDMRVISETIDLVKLGYSYVEGADKQGRLYFDTGVIYSKKLKVIRQSNGEYCYHEIYNITDNNSLRLFERYIFNLEEVNEQIVLYLSHWPSQLKNREIETNELAVSLKKEIRNILNENENVILMGDYNVEPYDRSIVKHLGSSRNKQQVKKNRTMLYNPCWKFLTSELDESVCGTYFYAPEHNHNWLILDQVLLSKNFLEEPWLFDDGMVTIIDIGRLIALETGVASNPSDHWPVGCTIFRV